MNGRLIAVVGPSGVGKDTVMEAMAEAEPRLGLVRRVITRPTGAGGEVFEGVTVPTFQAMARDGAFALSWSAHGLHYGIPVEVDAALGAGRDMLANLSRSVLMQAKARFPGLRVIALTADPDTLAQRLAGRGRESEKDILKRLSRVGTDLPAGFDVIRIDNSGALVDTVRAARDALYPVSA
ncbi:phosphonate metabolism protein/1,5-bisphosphokinase (PRPP-forming) PhnN [Tateyamaria omphalii]|uniref:phosphonate metabolism protein/1,5-bisphosphokinase (PRPP-forming) PhnN n=1 Tax=Tateyamaria omphalii TaxID=299262 RepID=UPI001C9954DE|nr:phosphonate metabolism protein/1,5-bisphosphokinase (PRPP-forming) PhnN [Tateyamaria omphalii]MBY5934709.1 phosphonate metabolism protein/1,5-bisphosphokinase (PRPP-forming) PhnN [Tateyamaria omphalii]